MSDENLFIAGGEFSDHDEPSVEILVGEDGEEITATTLAGASDQFSPRINVYENISFAGGDGDYSILSVLFDSNKVRLTCRECRQAVMDFPWMDMRFSTDSHIKGSIKAWRAAFPVVSNRKDIVDTDFGDADFVHIRGMRVYGYTVLLEFTWDSHSRYERLFPGPGNDHRRSAPSLDSIIERY